MLIHLFSRSNFVPFFSGKFFKFSIGPGMNMATGKSVIVSTGAQTAYNLVSYGKPSVAATNFAPTAMTMDLIDTKQSDLIFLFPRHKNCSKRFCPRWYAMILKRNKVTSFSCFGDPKTHC